MGMIRYLQEHRHKHFTKQKLKLRDSTVHSPDYEYLHCIWVCTFCNPSLLWLVCFWQNGEPNNFQEALLWWLLGEWRKRIEEQPNHQIYLLKLVYVPYAFQVCQVLLRTQEQIKQNPENPHLKIWYIYIYVHVSMQLRTLLHVHEENGELVNFGMRFLELRATATFLIDYHIYIYKYICS